MNQTQPPNVAEAWPLRLEVFYAFGLYGTARTAAEQLVQTRPDLRLEAWDVFDPVNAPLLHEKNIGAFPTVRLYRGEVLLAESTLAAWSPASLEHWIQAALKP